MSPVPICPKCERGHDESVPCEPTTDAGLRLSEDEETVVEAIEAAGDFYAAEANTDAEEACALRLFRALSRALVDRDTGMSVDEAGRELERDDRFDARRTLEAKRIFRAVRGTEG